jgi:hypothetical protein
LTFGGRITVNSISNAVIELDPITAQLAVDSGLDATVSLGLIEGIVEANAKLKGRVQLAYCPSCGGVYDDGFNRVSQTSSFYFNRSIGYELGGEVSGMLMASTSCAIAAFFGVRTNSRFVCFIFHS